MDKNFLAFSQVLQYNPIIKEDKKMREWYLGLLEKYIRKGKWKTNEIIKQEKKLYKNWLEKEKKTNNQDKLWKVSNISKKEYSLIILLDLFVIVGFTEKELQEDKLSGIINEYQKDFGQIRRDTRSRHITDISGNNKLYQCGWQKYRRKFWQKYQKNLWWTSRDILLNCLLAGKNDKEAWKWIKERCKTTGIKFYLKKIESNLDFIQKPPVSVLITAPMSAGKSTFLNAITGKRICASQNMACTSRICTIISKPFQDGLAYKWDKDLNLNASEKELVSGNEEGNEKQLAMGIYFNSNLGGERLIFYDTPGVNYSGDIRHKEITDKFIENGKYDFIIFLMNATQLGTTDEQKHLEKIKKHAKKKPVIFVINKIDEINPDEEDFNGIIKRQEKRLINMGFKNPLICPVSAQSALLVYKWRNGKINKLEQIYLYNQIDKFEKMDLPAYYNRKYKDIFVADKDNEEEQLLKTSGVAYVEELILKISRGYL